MWESGPCWRIAGEMRGRVPRVLGGIKRLAMRCTGAGPAPAVGVEITATTAAARLVLHAAIPLRSVPD